MTNQIEIAAKRNKSIGIILVTLYGAAWGLFGVIIGMFLLIASGAGPLPTSVTLLGVLSFALGILSLTSCYGLWVLAEWARKLEIALCIIGIPVSLASLAGLIPEQQTTSGSVIIDIVNIATAVLIIWYLSRGDVKTLFPEAGVRPGSQSFSKASSSQFCTQCGNRLEAGRRFCPSCGSAAEQ